MYAHPYVYALGLRYNLYSALASHKHRDHPRSTCSNPSTVLAIANGFLLQHTWQRFTCICVQQTNGSNHNIWKKTILPILGLPRKIILALSPLREYSSDCSELHNCSCFNSSGYVRKLFERADCSPRKL